MGPYIRYEIHKQFANLGENYTTIHDTFNEVYMPVEVFAKLKQDHAAFYKNTWDILLFYVSNVPNNKILQNNIGNYLTELKQNLKHLDQYYWNKLTTESQYTYRTIAIKVHFTT